MFPVICPIFLLSFYMIANQVFKYERFVKCLIYSLCFVGNLFLFQSCSESQPYTNPQFQAVYEIIDQRDTARLFPLLSDSDLEIRRIAAWGLGSIPDSSHALLIAKAIQNENDEAVLDALAFALGQTASARAAKQVWNYFRSKKVNSYKLALCDAFGKCGLEAFFIDVFDADKLNDSHASGLFYLARSGKLASEKLRTSLLKLVESESQSGVYAAHAFARSGFDLTPLQMQLLKSIQQSNNQQKKIALIQALGKSNAIRNNALHALYNSHNTIENQFVRLAVIRAARKAKLIPDLTWIVAMQNEASHHVREGFADWLLEIDTLIHAESIDKWIQTEPFALVKYRLHAYLLNHNVNANLRIEELKKDFAGNSDVYVQTYIINALASDFTAIQFLEELLYSTPDILIRQHAFEALIKLRSSQRFSLYRDQWKALSKQTLEAHFRQIFRDAIETHDVSMISLAAIALRDTGMLLKDAPGIPVQFESLDFMRVALASLKLPRDIEAFGELLHTISFYDGKPYEGSLKPDYNNPPDWDFVKATKPRQQVEVLAEAGQITLELWPDVAPLTVASFIKNIERGFYNNKRIHRLVPGFVIQDGCPRGDGYGGAAETIRSEFSDRMFEAGVVGMASAGPDTESTQWFIMQCDAPHLNGRYTAFGKVVSGLEHVLNMKHGGRIISMRIIP